MISIVRQNLGPAAHDSPFLLEVLNLSYHNRDLL